MRVALVADVHVGNHTIFGGPMESGLNARARDIISWLEHAETVSRREKCDLFIIAGDLFDSDEPSPTMIFWTARALCNKAAVERHDKIYAVNGNHEMTSTASCHTAISPLQNSGVDTVEDWCVHNGTIAMVGFKPGPAVEWLPKNTPSFELSPGPKLLVIHLGLEHSGTPVHMRGHDDSIPVEVLADICNEHGFTHVAAGNWHQAWEGVVKGVHMKQIGALVPTGFNNVGIEPYGRIAIWDSDNGFEKDFVIGGPRFLKENTLEGVASLRDLEGGVYDIYVHADLHLGEYPSAQHILEGLKSKGVVKDFKITRAKGEILKAAEETARVATSATDLDEALFDWILAMDLDPGVDLGGRRNMKKAGLRGQLEEITSISTR
jgi:hypothetical protein